MSHFSALPAWQAAGGQHLRGGHCYRRVWSTMLRALLLLRSILPTGGWWPHALLDVSAVSLCSWRAGAVAKVHCVHIKHSELFEALLSPALQASLAACS